VPGQADVLFSDVDDFGDALAPAPELSDRLKEMKAQAAVFDDPATLPKRQVDESIYCGHFPNHH
jgi:hypothetical protein